MKETNSLAKSGLIDHIFIAGFGEANSQQIQPIDDKRTMHCLLIKDRVGKVNILIKILNILLFGLRVIKLARNKNIKIVNVHSIGLLPFGVLIKWLCGAKLIYDAHELETETLHKTGLVKLIAKVMERVLIQFVDLTIVVSDGINEWYQQKYNLMNIVTVMNCPPYHKLQKTNLLREELKIPNKKRIVLYQGGLFPGRGIESLLQAFTAHDDKKHVLVFMGFGELEDLVTTHAKNHSNIYFQTAATPDNVLKYTSSADIGIHLIPNTCLNHELCLPNKFFEYIMVGLPVIINDLPEMGRVLNEKNIGATIKEGAKTNIYQKLNEISSKDQDALFKDLANTAEKYCWENQEKIMIEAYKKHIIHSEV